MMRNNYPWVIILYKQMKNKGFERAEKENVTLETFSRPGVKGSESFRRESHPLRHLRGFH